MFLVACIQVKMPVKQIDEVNTMNVSRQFKVMPNYFNVTKDSI